MPIGFLGNALKCRTNRSVANNLTKGAEGAVVLDGVQARPMLVGKPAYGLRGLVVVKNLNGEEMELPARRQAHNQGMEPVVASESAYSFQFIRLHPAG